MDRPGGHKTHLGATPYLGGVAVAGGLLLVGWLSAGASGQLLVVVGGALVLGFVGLLDDVQPVSPWIRLAYQVVAAIALWLVGVRAGVFDATWIDLPITVLWVVAVTNAFNFIDNMDGIAAGVAIASALGIAAIAGVQRRLPGDIAGARHRRRRARLPPLQHPSSEDLPRRRRVDVAGLHDRCLDPRNSTSRWGRRRLACCRRCCSPASPCSICPSSWSPGSETAADLARQHRPHIAPDGRRRSFAPPGARVRRSPLNSTCSVLAYGRVPPAAGAWCISVGMAVGAAWLLMLVDVPSHAGA